MTPYAVGHALGVGERLAVVWVSLALAIASFTWVEQPVRLLHWPTWGWVGTGAGLGGLVTACAALVMVLGPATTGTGAATVLAAVDTPSSSATSAPARTGGATMATTTSTEQAVARTIAAAVGTTQVPSNLTPLPQDAADSLPPTSTNGCHAGFTAVTQGDCRYGDLTASRTVVLFGDSHAEQWLPALDQLGKAQHWQVVSWTKAACPAARLTVDNPSLGRSYTECDTWRQATVARIGALRPALVVVSQSENVASSSVTPQAFSTATVATVQALRSAGAAKVSYVQDIPTPGTDLPGCVATHLDDVRACTYDRAAAYRYPDRHAAMAPALAAAGVPVLDPAPWLCTSTRCPPSSATSSSTATSRT